MMERFISRGLMCKCATHFSPPVKKTKLTLIFFESLHQKRKTVSLCKEKETEKRGSFALGFAESRGRNQSLLQPSSTLHQWLQVW